MREFDKICKGIDNLSVAEYTTILAAKSMKLLAELKLLTADGIEGDMAFITFIIGSVVADGKLSEEEYLLIYPLLEQYFGDEVNYEDCKKLVRKSLSDNRDIKNIVNAMTDIFGQLSDELKEDAITVCLLICSVDGKISIKEKMWVKQLIKE